MNQAIAPIYLSYQLRLKSPAIVSTLSGDPNGALTQPFIPGSALRGALAARLIATGVSGDSAEFRQLILSGDVRYLHAYPEQSKERALPCSGAWKQGKAARASTFDLASFGGAVDGVDDPDDFDWPKDTLAGVSDQFGAASGSLAKTTTPKIGSRIHQQRDREKGRSWTRTNGQSEERYGAIFCFEYLEAEQSFRGLIQLMPAAAAAAESIKTRLGDGPILVGRSRRAGYGGEAKVDFGEDHNHEYANVSRIDEAVPTGKEFRVLLTSAYIGRHPTTGQMDPSALQFEVERRLPVQVERTRWNFEVVGGFNQKWRLEIPQAQAVTAGAVLVLRSTADIPLESLRSIEHQGMGERRVEGFGRVLFQTHSEDRESFRLGYADVERDESPAVVRSASAAERDQLDLLERRIVLAAVQRELDQIIHLDIVSNATSRPTNSLLGRLRTLFRAVIDEKTAHDALGNLATWYGEGDDALKDRARRQLEKCRMETGNLHSWLKSLSDPTTGDAARRLLAAVGDSASRLRTVPETHYLTNKESAQGHLDAHSAALCVYLIDGVLAALAKQNSGSKVANHD